AKATPAKADGHMPMGGMHDEGANKNKTFSERLVS
ncbi:MAG: hypothetical protein ACJAWY_002848, partial [Sphingomonas echinoides]